MICKKCNGDGKQYNSWDGIWEPCSSCDGTGVRGGGYGDKKCFNCGGKGYQYDHDEREEIRCPICRGSGTYNNI